MAVRRWGLYPGLYIIVFFFKYGNNRIIGWIIYFQQLIAFKDIKPAATFHFLIIPKNHVANVYSLTAGEKQMRKQNLCISCNLIDVFGFQYLTWSESCWNFLLKTIRLKLVIFLLAFMFHVSVIRQCSWCKYLKFQLNLSAFNSIQHLHLHGISPVSEIKFLRKLSFYENSFWYKTVDTVIESLR